MANRVIAKGRSLNISRKQSIEICNAIRGKPVVKANALLQRVVEKKEAVPFKRFTEMGHRPGKIMTGRYPYKACNIILQLLHTAEANAEVQGLSTADLVISRLVVNKAASQWHYGRQHRRKMKRCHIDIEVREQAQPKADVKKEKSAKEAGEEKSKVVAKEQPKVETKPVAEVKKDQKQEQKVPVEGNKGEKAQ